MYNKTKLRVPHKNRIVIISGLSGSGKTYALHALEDLGFFCIDNLPSTMLPQFINLSSHKNSNIEKSAVCIDIRERNFLEKFLQIFPLLKERAQNIEVVFLDAKNEALLRRFSETRRPHPLAPEGELIKGILLEREKLVPIKNCADVTIDTSDLNVHQLKKIIQDRYADQKANIKQVFNVNIISFGFKYGTPANLDLLFDVRFLPNPHFKPELKDFTGNDRKVVDFMFAHENTRKFMDILENFFHFTIPQFQEEGRSYLAIGIGCTGGKHRSVALANKLEAVFQKQNIKTTVTHRDIEQ